MQNEHRAAFNVRLNLNKPAHRRAWECLQTRDTSYSETCVAAINAMAYGEVVAKVKSALGGIIRDAVTEALRQMPMTMMPAETDTSTNDGILSDDDFDIADEFMNSL